MNLNLARKWRSKNFDQVIGQVMPVRMLKNSLYLNQFFPVYLFSGQHGCGKTSTARIFAAAINCFSLLNFQQKPREHSVPCGTCDSCCAMSKGRHPDFFEIDAASHTGVDMIRQIIEAATLLPLMGNKKVYLIDEAHMLSKAAFNALLKILEEPPASVLFILATTDEQKILETVQSRCFKLFFSPVQQVTLVQHLMFLCDQEKITYQQPGLELIAQESSGSVRDAINLLEQVRFSSSAVTKEVVMRVLGRIDDATLIQLLEVLFSGDTQKFVQTLHEIRWQQYGIDALWRQLMALVRALLWHKYGSTVDQFNQHRQELAHLAQQCSIVFLHRMMQALYNHEQLFMRTTSGHDLLEVILLQLCYKKGGNEGASGATTLNALAPVASSSDEEDDQEDTQEDDKEIEQDEDASMVRNNGLWVQFVRGIEQLDDALLLSIIKQAKFLGIEASTHGVKIHFVQGGLFFKDVIEDAKEQWDSLFKELFGMSAELVLTFDVQQQEIRSSEVVTNADKMQAPIEHQQKPNASLRVMQSTPVYQQRAGKQNIQRVVHDYGPALNVSDAQQWPITHMILRHFPGQVYEMRENR